MQPNHRNQKNRQQLDNAIILHAIRGFRWVICFYLRMSITTVVITAARNTKPPKTPKAITAPRFNFAWWVLLDWSALSTLKGPEGSGTPVPMPAWALSTPLPEISLSWGWSLVSSFRGGDGGGAGLWRPIFGFLAMVSRTVAGNSAVLATLRGGTEVVVVVVVEIVVVRTRGGKNVCRVLLVVGRTVVREDTVTVVRGSSVIKKFWRHWFSCNSNLSHRFC